LTLEEIKEISQGKDIKIISVEERFEEQIEKTLTPKYSTFLKILINLGTFTGVLLIFFILARVIRYILIGEKLLGVRK